MGKMCKKMRSISNIGWISFTEVKMITSISISKHKMLKLIGESGF